MAQYSTTTLLPTGNIHIGELGYISNLISFGKKQSIIFRKIVSTVKMSVTETKLSSFLFMLNEFVQLWGA